MSCFEIIQKTKSFNKTSPKKVYVSVGLVISGRQFLQ